MRPREFIQVLEDPSAPKYTKVSEQADMLRTLLVHLFFADLDLDKGEFALLERVLPDMSHRAYIQGLAVRRLDLTRMAELFPDPADREDIVTLAEHAVWGDNRVKHVEWELVERVVEALGVVRP